MFKNLAKIFGFENKQDLSSESEIINYATTAIMGTGVYAMKSMTDDWQEWAKKMQNELGIFEQKAYEY